MRRRVGQPLYAVFARHERRGVEQLCIPVTLDEAKEFMRVSHCFMFYTYRRIRRITDDSKD